METKNVDKNTCCFPLSKLKRGESAFIESINTEPSMYRRLLDLGLTKGIKITCLMTSPFGDPKAYLIRGTVIGLRNKDAKNIIIFQ